MLFFKSQQTSSSSWWGQSLSPSHTNSIGMHWLELKINFSIYLALWWLNSVSSIHSLKSITYLVHTKCDVVLQNEGHVTRFSSLLSPQSTWESHSLCGWVIFKYVAHVKLEHCGGSSDPSGQSFTPSQMRFLSMHILLFLHSNSCTLQAEKITQIIASKNRFY